MVGLACDRLEGATQRALPECESNPSPASTPPSLIESLKAEVSALRRENSERRRELSTVEEAQAFAFHGDYLDHCLTTNATRAFVIQQDHVIAAQVGFTDLGATMRPTMMEGVMRSTDGYRRARDSETVDFDWNAP